MHSGRQIHNRIRRRLVFTRLNSRFEFAFTLTSACSIRNKQITHVQSAIAAEKTIFFLTRMTLARIYLARRAESKRKKKWLIASFATIFGLFLTIYLPTAADKRRWENAYCRRRTKWKRKWSWYFPSIINCTCLVVPRPIVCTDTFRLKSFRCKKRFISGLKNEKKNNNDDRICQLLYGCPANRPVHRSAKSSRERCRHMKFM